MQQSSLVSVLVLNWNGENLLQDCLSSLKKTSYPETEIVIFDNASTDRSVEIASGFNKVKVVQSDRNLGFAAGNNAGLKHCTGDTVVLLNNDTLVEPTWLDEPMKLLAQHASAGSVSCRQMNHFDRSRIDCLYHYPTKYLSFAVMGDKQNWSPDEALFSEGGHVIGPSGASSVYRRSVLEQLGGFDERFGAYVEDCDLSMRAFLAGFDCLYAPTSVVYHKVSYSYSKKRDMFYYYLERNRLWFMYKHFPAATILRHLFWILFLEARTVRVKIFKEHSFTPYLKARRDTLSGLALLTQDRKRLTRAFEARKQRFYAFVNDRKLPA